jgi:hypothetical protein
MCSNAGRHWAFIIAYVGAGAYTAVRFFSDLQAAETFGGCLLAAATYSLLISLFASSANRPRLPGS